MPRYKVLKPLGWHGRHEPGEEVVMDESEAAAIGPAYLEAVVRNATPETPETKPKKSRKKDAEAS